MKLSFLLFSVLLLQNFPFGHSLIIDRNGENQYLDKKTTFTDLNADCLYIIFEQLSLNELINIAQISLKFASVANDIFRRKYSGYEVRIENLGRDRVERPYNIKKSSIFIRISDFEMASNIMKYFGNQIRMLVIRNRSDRDYTSGSEWLNINRIVNEYASESLTHLNLGAVRKELWPQFSVPFKNIEKLDIEIITDTDGMKLNQLCPNLRELRINLFYDVKYDFIDCKLPHLELLDIVFSDDMWHKEESIIELIKKNPQIRSVDALQSAPEMVKMIQELLPNLEKLKLNFNDNQNEPLHFGNVKYCVLESWHKFSIRNLSFSHLESLETSISDGELEKYTEFFQRHSNLSHLYLRRKWDSTLPLEELTAELPNLVIMIVKYYNGVHSENVIRFIETHPKLMKFQFPVHQISKPNREVLRKRFERDWHIKSIVDDKDAFLFERKEKL